MQQPIAPQPDLPRVPAHRGVVALSAGLISLWAIFTFGAGPITPLVIFLAERVEIGLGLDRMQGEGGAKGAP